MKRMVKKDGKRSNRGLGVFLLAVLLAACGNDGTKPAADETVKTGFPGQVTANGGTSGEVMAAATGKVQNNSDPSGTPGIPQGSEGNTGGAALGGTTGSSEGAADRPSSAGNAAGPSGSQSAK